MPLKPDDQVRLIDVDRYPPAHPSRAKPIRTGTRGRVLRVSRGNTMAFVDFGPCYTTESTPWPTQGLWVAIRRLRRLPRRKLLTIRQTYEAAHACTSR